MFWFWLFWHLKIAPPSFWFAGLRSDTGLVVVVSCYSKEERFLHLCELAERCIVCMFALGNVQSTQGNGPLLCSQILTAPGTSVLNKAPCDVHRIADL